MDFVVVATEDAHHSTSSDRSLAAWAIADPRNGFPSSGAPVTEDLFPGRQVENEMTAQTDIAQDSASISQECMGFSSAEEAAPQVLALISRGINTMQLAGVSYHHRALEGVGVVEVAGRQPVRRTNESLIFIRDEG